MSQMKTLEDAFIHELGDTYSAEKQIARALPKMVKAASDPELKKLLEKHQGETEQQIKRLEQCFEAVGRKPRATKCEAMEGLLEEGKNVLEEEAAPEVCDAMIIAASQKVEHYEIATYGTLCTWGEMIGLDGAVRLLKQNLGEERQADELLTQAAMKINEQANAPSEEEEEEVGT